MGLLRFELKSIAPEARIDRCSTPVKHDILHEFIEFRKIEGLCDRWIVTIRQYLTDYMDYVNWRIDKKKTLQYLNKIRDKQTTTSYRKIVYQIRKFLTYLNVDWAKDIKLPSEPLYLPKRVTPDNIKETLSYFKDNQYYLQIKSLIQLGISSGMRAEELYQLTIEDIDIDNRVVHINHNPQNGQSTKTKMSRISLFNKQTQQILSKYLTYFNNGSNLKMLFSQSHIKRLFRDAPIQVKDLRKFFSQEWDRRGGPTSIKKILMGHSLKGDVDLMHYNAQSEEDLKRIYDKIMN
jgi:integrase/recombinase XerD